METLVGFLHNLQGIIEPLNTLLGFGSASSSATSSTATSSAVSGLGETARTIFLALAKVILWGMDLTRAMLVRLVELLS